MKIAICDDDKKEMCGIVSILDEYVQQRNTSIMYKIFYSGAELLATIKSECYDIYLLDVIMPIVNGLDTAKEIRNFDKVAKIIFLTSSPEFAVESYAVKACNYILKPLEKERLFLALDDIVETISKENEAAIVVKSCEGIV